MARDLDIAYGTETATAGQAGHAARPRLILTLPEGRALRIGDIDHALLPAPGPSELSSAEAQTAALRQHLLRLCGGFNRFATGLIESYFAALQAELTARAAEVSARIGALAGLVEPAHLISLAPLPLPRAHLALPGGRSLRVPVAFHDRAGLVLCFRAEEAMLPQTRADLDGLRATGSRVLRLSRAELAPDDLLARLGADFQDFIAAPGLPSAAVRAGRIGAPQPF